MKRFVSILVALVLCLSMLCFVACTPDDGSDEGVDTSNPKTAVATALTKTQTLNEFYAKTEITMDMVISVMGTQTTVSVPMSMAIKVKGADTQNPEVYTEVEASVMGSVSSTVVYVKDGWTYTFDGTIGTKTQNSEAEDYSDEIEEILKSIPEDLLENKTFETVEGGFKITVQIPDDVFGDIYDDMIDSLTESYGDVDVTVSNAVVAVILNNSGYVINYDMEFDMAYEMTISGVTASATVHASSTTEIVNPGQSVEIEAPQGYENYPEV